MFFNQTWASQRRLISKSTLKLLFQRRWMLIFTQLIHKSRFERRLTTNQTLTMIFYWLSRWNHMSVMYMPLTIHLIRCNRKYRSHLQRFIPMISGIRLHGLRSHIFWLLQPSNLIFNSFQKLNRWQSLFKILLKTPSQYLFNLLVTNITNTTCHQIITHLWIGQILIRSITNQHLIQYYTYTPKITFRTIYVITITFRTHISRAANIIKNLWFFCLIQKLTKSKISYPSPSRCQKNICCLKISMNYLLILYSQIPLNYLTN